VSAVVYRLLATMPTPVATRIAGGLMKGTDFAATNVPGPPIPLFFARSKLLSMVPFAPKGGAAVNIALMSYDGKIFLGINVDRGAVEDPGELTDAIATSLQEVLAVGRKTP
ncbi:MAG: WS/DGAT domain-containing protein, partial [Actinomycetes bacterium]